MAELFSQVAVPVATLDTEEAFLGAWRLMSIDGTELDVPDNRANRERFGPVPVPSGTSAARGPRG
jgi:hypothetical protein